MTEIYDALENCLQAMERGASIDTALKRYPKMAAELRPLLQAASLARDSGRVHVPLDVRRRGRTRLAQRYQELRDARSAPRRVIPAFPRLALTGLLVAALALTSTGLVSASSASIPGDHLYPVKRTWESVQLMFVFNTGQRDLMESSFEQERLDEISELIGRRQAEPIAFSGILARRLDGNWVVSGIPVSVSPSTNVVGGTVADGVPITIVGMTRADGVVEAQHVQVLQPGSSLPPLEPSEHSDHEANSAAEEGDSGATPVAQPTPPATQQASPNATQPTTYQYSGVVQSMVGNVWRINGQTVYVDTASISGQVTIGSIVRLQGYYSANGTFVVTSMEPQSGGTSTKHGGSDGSGSGGEGGDGGDGHDGSGGSGGHEGP